MRWGCQGREGKRGGESRKERSKDREEERHFVPSKCNSHDCSGLVGKYWMKWSSITLYTHTHTHTQTAEACKSLNLCQTKRSTGIPPPSSPVLSRPPLCFSLYSSLLLSSLSVLLPFVTSPVSLGFFIQDNIDYKKSPGSWNHRDISVNESPGLKHSAIQQWLHSLWQCSSNLGSRPHMGFPDIQHV